MGSRARSLVLRSLGYPVADKFAVEDSGGFRKLIVWLEDTKVRQRATNPAPPVRGGCGWKG